MKNFIPFLAIFFLLAACGDDDNASSNTDLTELAVGVYYINGDESDGIITINKKDNETVTVSLLDKINFVVDVTFSFQDVILNNESSFSLNQIDLTSPSFCGGSIKLNGNGTVSSTAISIFLNLFDGEGLIDETYSCLYENRELTVSGIRQ